MLPSLDTVSPEEGKEQQEDAVRPEDLASKYYAGRIFQEAAYTQRVCKCPGREADIGKVRTAEDKTDMFQRRVIDFGRLALAKHFRVQSEA